MKSLGKLNGILAGFTAAALLALPAAAVAAPITLITALPANVGTGDPTDPPAVARSFGYPVDPLGLPAVQLDNFECQFIGNAGCNSFFSYSTNSGRALASIIDGVDTPSGFWNLFGTRVGQPIGIGFANPVLTAGLWFGNDDRRDADPPRSLPHEFDAVLEVFFANGDPSETVRVAANLNDSNDQFIGFLSDRFVQSMTLSYLRINAQQQEEVVPDLIVFVDDVQVAQVAPIPEPATLLLMGAGLAGIAVRMRRKKAAR